MSTMITSQEALRDHLFHMRQLEESPTYQVSDYLHAQKSSSSSSNICSTSTCAEDNTIDEICRSKMADWSMQVISYIKFRKDTVLIAMNYLDRFLCTDCPRARSVMHCRKEYQLAAMTTLFMAIKINEPVMIDVGLLTELSKGVYVAADFKQMEIDILFGLNWRVNGPTAHTFAAELLSLLMEQLVEQQEQQHYPQQPEHRQDQMSDNGQTMSLEYHKILAAASYQIELSVGEYNLMTQKPSVMAAASIWNCFEEDMSSRPNESFRHQFFDLVSAFDIQMEDIMKARESLYVLKCNAHMRMDTTSTPPASHQAPQRQQQQQQQRDSPRSATATATATGRKSNSKNVQCTKGDKHHCSPICVSKRKLNVH